MNSHEPVEMNIKNEPKIIKVIKRRTNNLKSFAWVKEK